MAMSSRPNEGLTLFSAPKRLAFADGLRGLAACWVVLFHMSEGKHLEALQAALPPFLYRIVFSMGDLGVPVFFVLSGYVMALTTSQLRFTAPVSFRFVARRLIRLMPAYYFAIAFVLIISLVKQKFLGQGAIYFDIKTLAAHATLSQGFWGFKNIDPVFWTLCVEVQFYVAFSILMWVKSCFWGGDDKNSITLFLVASIVAMLWPLGLVVDSLWQGGFLPYWYCFMAGVWACLYRDFKGIVKNFSIGYVLILFSVGMNSELSAAVTASVTAALLMLAAYLGKEDRWLSARWVQFLGLISYSLYLIHNPLTGAAFNIVKRVLPSGALSDVVGMVVVAVVCITASFAAYCVIERPSIALSRKLHLAAKRGLVAPHAA